MTLPLPSGKIGQLVAHKDNARHWCLSGRNAGSSPSYITQTGPTFLSLAAAMT